MKKSSFIAPPQTDLEDLFNKIIKTLKNKAILKSVKKGPVLYVGDIHGFYENVVHAFNLAKSKSVSTLIFMGDYGDRGPEQFRSFLNVIYSFATSEGLSGYLSEDTNNSIDVTEKYSFKVIALRGNHEDLETNRRYGFLDEISGFYKDSKKLIDLVEQIYDCLPIMVETSWKTIALHGGIPKLQSGESKKFVKKLKSMITPLSSNFGNNNDLSLSGFQDFNQVLWNDPDDRNFSSEPTFNDNMRGYGIYTYNRAALNQFLNENSYKRLIRAHEATRGAYQVLWNSQLIHLFSAYPYFGYIKEPAYFLEYEDGSGVIIDEKGKTLKEIKSLNS